MGDSRNLPNIGRAPTQAPVRRVFDVLLVPTTDAGTFEEFKAYPPVGNPAYDLGRGLSIVELDHDLVELVMNACSQRGHYFIATRQFGCRYAFALEQPQDPHPPYHWDPDSIIRQTLALSRLVRDNAYSTEYAARVVEYENDELQVIPHDGMESRHAYRLSDERDWLDASDADQLRALLDVWWEVRDHLPDRVRRALWRTEHLAWERYLDIGLPGMVAALEGLISTSTRHVTRQFGTRVPALAAEVGVPNVSKSFCRSIYTARSQGVHGNDIDLFRNGTQDAAVEKAARLQAVLRAAVRRGIEDVGFRAILTDDQAIREHWPVRVRAPGLRGRLGRRDML